MIWMLVFVCLCAWACLGVVIWLLSRAEVRLRQLKRDLAEVQASEQRYIQEIKAERKAYWASPARTDGWLSSRTCAVSGHGAGAWG